jgi:hypothetical protein
MSNAEAKINNGTVTENNPFAFKLCALGYDPCRLCSNIYCFLLHSILVSRILSKKEHLFNK